MICKGLALDYPFILQYSSVTICLLSRNRGGFSALHLSCQNGHNQSCRNILITGCKPDLKNDVSILVVVVVAVVVVDAVDQLTHPVL